MANGHLAAAVPTRHIEHPKFVVRRVQIVRNWTFMESKPGRGFGDQLRRFLPLFTCQLTCNSLHKRQLSVARCNVPPRAARHVWHHLAL